MTYASKKTTIFILIALFVVTMCFSFLALPKNVYGFTGNYEEYFVFRGEGVDTGITDDYSDSYTDSGSDDYTLDSLHYYVDYTVYAEIEEREANHSYRLYLEYYQKGYVENAQEEDLGYYEYSDSDSGIYTYTMDGTDYTRAYDYSVEGWYEISLPEEKISPPVRTHEMPCWQINITEDNKFELVFWYEYENNNWITIYDKDGNLVYRKDFPYGQPTVIIDLPDGTYTVKTFHEEGKILQEFVIGKP